MKAIFDKMDVGKKFIFTFIQIAIAVAINVIILLILLGNSDKDIKDFFAGPGASIQSQLTIRNELNTINQSLLNMVSEANAISTGADDIEQIKTSDNIIETEIQNIIKDSSKAANIDEFASYYHKSKAVFDTIGQHSSSGNHEDALAAYMDDFVPLLNSMNTSIEKIGEKDFSQVSTIYGRYETKKLNALLYFAIIASLALVFTGYVLNVFRSSLVVPLKKILIACDDLGSGKQIEELHIDSNDEFGAMANSFLKMSQNMVFIIDDTCEMLSNGAAKDLSVRSKDESKYIGKYRELIDSTYAIFSDISKNMKLANDIAEQVSENSTQISFVSQSLSQGSTEQASAIEQLSVTVSDIAELSRENAEQSSKAGEMSVAAAHGINESNSHMLQMLEAMNGIAATSEEIGKIVKAINDIAFQTNILSLNAAVEAARAGASGKGFAVVADEVRNLAQRSAEAAKNTTALIDSTVIAIENGKKIADETAKSLQFAEEKAGFISKTIVKIAEASQNQASATEQVLQSIEQVSSVVQTNSATAEESAAAAQELASQAKILSEMTSMYRLTQAENA